MYIIAFCALTATAQNTADESSVAGMSRQEYDAHAAEENKRMQESNGTTTTDAAPMTKEEKVATRQSGARRRHLPRVA